MSEVAPQLIAGNKLCPPKLFKFQGQAPKEDTDPALNGSSKKRRER